MRDAVSDRGGAGAVGGAERDVLLHGPYAAPRCRVGGTLFCLSRRRKLKVGGLTDAPVVWPYSRQSGPRSLVLCGDLARAVREESVSAVCHHWGVARKTVWTWRKALGVPMRNEGTARLYRATVPDRVDLDSLARARAASKTPEARARRSAALKGRPPHPSLRAAAAAAARRPKSESFRRQMSARVRSEWEQGLRRGHPPGRPWAEAEVARLGTAPDAAVARELGRTPAAVQMARLRLGIPAFAGPRR